VARFADELADFNPRSWLLKYRRTSLGYMTKMVLFYHAIGIGLGIAGTAIIELLVPGYEEPSVPRSLIGVLGAGPMEESLFFGIPFYVSGHPYAMLVTGSFWALLHVINTPVIEVTSLSYANWLFAVPSLFLSLRLWASGKGWFAVLAHSAWNGIIFASGCAAGEIECTLTYGSFEADFWTVVQSAILVGITFALYRWRQRKRS
jgi:hypothetical protein